MIVKKLYRKVKCKWWNKERKVFENVITTDYIGWFLFGFIPIYLIQLDKNEELNFVDGEEAQVFEYKVFKDYGHLVRK